MKNRSEKKYANFEFLFCDLGRLVSYRLEGQEQLRIHPAVPVICVHGRAIANVCAALKH